MKKLKNQRIINELDKLKSIVRRLRAVRENKKQKFKNFVKLLNLQNDEYELIQYMRLNNNILLWLKNKIQLDVMTNYCTNCQLELLTELLFVCPEHFNTICSYCKIKSLIRYEFEGKKDITHLLSEEYIPALVRINNIILPIR